MRKFLGWCDAFDELRDAPTVPRPTRAQADWGPRITDAEFFLIAGG